MSDVRNVGARSATGRRKHGLGWLPWLLLLLILAIAVGAFFLIREINEDDESAPAAVLVVDQLV